MHRCDLLDEFICHGVLHNVKGASNNELNRDSSLRVCCRTYFKYVYVVFLLQYFRQETTRAFRSVVDRLLCMLKVKGSNPLMSILFRRVRENLFARPQKICFLDSIPDSLSLRISKNNPAGSRVHPKYWCLLSIIYYIPHLIFDFLMQMSDNRSVKL